MWETQDGKFTTSKKVNVYFCPPEFSATNIVTCQFHVDECTNSIYDMYWDWIFPPPETPQLATKNHMKGDSHLWLS